MKWLKFISLLLLYPMMTNVNALPGVHSSRLMLVSGLPVTSVKAKTDKQDKFVLFITGDGGYNSFSQKLVASYTANGFNVIALNSFKYFWKKKAPQETANDIAGLLNTYLNEWHKQKVVICGFSFGADVTPFIYTRLPADLRAKVTMLQLISPASFTDFEIHMMDMLGSGNGIRAMNVVSEANQVDIPVICYYGEQEPEKPLAVIKKTNFSTVILPGGHHCEKSFPEIAKNAL